MKQASNKKKRKKDLDSDKDLVCVFLGLELYTTKKAANLLRTEVMELLRTDLKEIPLLAVKTHPPVELAPTLSVSWDKIRTIITKNGKAK